MAQFKFLLPSTTEFFFDLPGPTCGFGQLMIGAVEDKETDVTFFDSFESLVNVALPHSQPINNRTVLVLKYEREKILYTPTNLHQL